MPEKRPLQETVGKQSVGLLNGGSRIITESEFTFPLKITFNHTITSKLDLGVHNRLTIEQEEYCFDIAFDDEGASLLINSNEQMFTEKLRSLLRFGPVSTRYKDEEMRKNDIQGILKRIKRSFSDRFYRRNLAETDKKWVDDPVDKVLDTIFSFLEGLE